MHEDDAVALALYRIGGGDKETQPQAGRAKQRRQHPEQRNQPARHRVKARRTGEAEPFIQPLFHSRAILNAAVVAHGVKNTASTSNAASSDK